MDQNLKEVTKKSQSMRIYINTKFCKINEQVELIMLIDFGK